jgi:hypothetical protein
MPDYNFNTNLGPAAQPTTSLGDMVNLARGVQAYQQQGQLNPLQLEKAQMEIEQAKKINPLTVRQQTAAAGTAELGLNEKQTSALFGLAGGVLNDPRIQKGSKEDVMSALKEAQNRSSTFGIPKNVIDDVFGQLNSYAEKNHGSVKQVLGNIIQSGIGATGQQSLQTPQLATVGGAPATFTSGTGTAVPLNIGGDGNTNLAKLPASGGAVEVGTKPTGVTPIQMSLSYPVRKAGDIRPFAPNEEKDQASGFEYRDKLSKTVSSMPASLRNIDEVIKEAEKIGKNEWNKGSGFAATVGRNVSTFLGTEQGDSYKRLSKDLAQLQLSLGADTSTDAGKNLLAAANGDITLPPDVLVDIAHRSKADRQNLSMQASGAQVFAKKYGDSNMKTFQEMWSENSKDTRLFEAIAINNSNMSTQEKKDRIDELFKGLTAKQIDKLAQQKNNLIKLSRTGEL